ncbi:MAG: CPBP family intramembrane metalloprotease [Candidatus Margulisiibacteriota bacterium]|nr:MAG: CPBP family intramembrane metalloprotease [Candidatus Margulisiibacteriota bacterium]HAR63898.1 CPBP family intramembrane metalloprotease domain-containing protein [Candidatus Margulisiibacteriota bacterium]HCY37650.1 CPBP family intramembrane metalloprotease domain-containing protein [Candidatus Margulisiibacteriota bacterium]
MNSVNRKKVILFVVLTYLIDWSMVVIFMLRGGKWNSSSALMLSLFYMLVPMLVTIVFQKYIYKENMKEQYGLSFKVNKWFLAAWLLPALLAFAALGVALLLPGVHFSPDMSGMIERFSHYLTPEQMQQLRHKMATMTIHPLWLTLFQGLFAGATINAVVAFGEELGWRGFLQKELGGLGFWRSSFLIGIIWGLWHAPLVLHGLNYPQHPVAGIYMMTIWAVLLSPIIAYIRLRAKSVLAAAVMHGTLNATYGISIMVVSGGSDLTVGLTGLAGFIVLIVANLILYYSVSEY